ncbi:glycine betaine ABC transporter substrate-binding protein [Glutamicibacter sp. NPDC055491]
MTLISHTSKAKLPAIALAAVASVVFWSLKPIFISIIGDRGDYAEVYVVSATIAVLSSLVFSLIFWRKTKNLFRRKKSFLRAVGWSAISGFFLATWYYGYYRALYSASMTDATVIAFTWPLIATIAIRIFTPKTAGKLKPAQWLLILASFVGAVAIGISNIGMDSSSGSNHEIIWAFVAALGSGLYLPFAFKATAEIDKCIDSKPFATFYAISIANAISLGAVLALLGASHHTLRFYAFDSQVIFVCALIGLGTYLVAEVTWTWAFQEYKSLTLSSLPYFAPAASVILLHVIFDEPVRPIAMIGLVLILFSNLTLHANQQTTNALGLTLVATVYVALASQILPLESSGAIPELTAALTGLFAILAGFILSRVSARRTEEIDARALLVRRCIALDPSNDKVLSDSLLCQLLEYEFSETAAEKQRHLLKIYELLSSATPTEAQKTEEARDALASWMAIHDDRLSIGESVALWMTGLGSVIFVLLLRDASPFGTAGSVVFAAGAFLLIFTIRDYDRNNLHGFRNQLRRLQQGFQEIGKKSYVPAELVESGFVTAKTFEGTEIRYGKSTITASTEPNFQKRRIFDSVYLGTAIIVILIILLLPISKLGLSAGTRIDSPRPGDDTAVSGTASEEQQTITITDPGWAAAQVTSEIISAVLSANDIPNAIVPQAHLSAAEQFLSKSSEPLVHPDLWLQNQSTRFQDAVESKNIKLSAHSYSTSQGIYILDSAETKSHVTGLASLRNSVTAELFDTDSDGKGELWIGARGWSTADSLDKWIQDHDLPAVETEMYSESIFKAKLDAFANKNKPVIFYGYVPDDIHRIYDLRLLDPLDRSISSGDVEAFVARTPAVAEISSTADRILDQMAFSVDDMNEFIEQEQEGVDPKLIADNWMENHAERVTRWQEVSSAKK